MIVSLPLGWAVFAATVAIAAAELGHIAKHVVATWANVKATEHGIALSRLQLDREILDRTHPRPVETTKRTIVVPPAIEEQLADAPEWEREDTRARAVELYEELERKFPDDKAVDRWGRVHKLLELETEAVESSV
jgi:hypothetical protein